MKNKTIWLVLCVLVLSLVLASCAEKATSTATIPATTATSTSGAVTTTNPTVKANWWDKFGTPQYGGTMVVRVPPFSPTLDPSKPGGSPAQLMLESLFGEQWALDRNTWNYQMQYIPPEYLGGLLADNWEQTDLKTFIVHLRQGIHFTNKAPVNGREITADDVAYCYDRILGTGHGFTQPSPFLAGNYTLIDSVTAADTYTLRINFKVPTYCALLQAYNSPAIYPREVIDEMPGGSEDWQNAIGTGAWSLVDFVSGSTITYDKNPDYWQTDERYPENKLPYLDHLRGLIIADNATAVAAIRTQKIDITPYQFGALSIQDGQTLAKSNPEMQQVLVPVAGYELDIRCDNAPFTDVRVRQALNMAIDRSAIAKSLYLGQVDGTPDSLVNKTNTTWATPFAKWPVETQQIYTYNPEQAKKLLADAGYADGFKTNCYVVGGASETGLLEIIKGYFAEIKVDMTINPVDGLALMGMTAAGKHDQMVTESFMAGTGSGDQVLILRASNGSMNFTHNNDSTFDGMYADFQNAATEEQAIEIFKKADMYAMQQAWSVNVFGSIYPVVWQPYVRGYSGENLNSGGMSQVFSGMWLDSSLKNR